MTDRDFTAELRALGDRLARDRVERQKLHDERDQLVIAAVVEGRMRPNQVAKLAGLPRQLPANILSRHGVAGPPPTGLLEVGVIRDGVTMREADEPAVRKAVTGAGFTMGPAEPYGRWGRTGWLKAATDATHADLATIEGVDARLE